MLEILGNPRAVTIPIFRQNIKTLSQMMIAPASVCLDSGLLVELSASR
tara:strand:- start:5492 stop:5635 length:144 start_codon:yes stop_codon:yes gene_type:complete